MPRLTEQEQQEIIRFIEADFIVKLFDRRIVIVETKYELACGQPLNRDGFTEIGDYRNINFCLNSAK